MKMESIHSAIQAHFKTHKYRLFNSYIFNWESDYFGVTQDGRKMYEVEIKISRSDFKADFVKQNKHKALLAAKENPMCVPNRFYYCCPDNMIKVSELPSYAGLLYIEDRGKDTTPYIRQIKSAPLLHSTNNTDKYLRNLVDKFYFQWLNMRSDYRWAKNLEKSHADQAKELSRLQSMEWLSKDGEFIQEIDKLKLEIKKHEASKSKLLSENFKLKMEVMGLNKLVNSLQTKLQQSPSLSIVFFLLINIL